MLEYLGLWLSNWHNNKNSFWVTMRPRFQNWLQYYTWLILVGATNKFVSVSLFIFFFFHTKDWVRRSMACWLKTSISFLIELPLGSLSVTAGLNVNTSSVWCFLFLLWSFGWDILWPIRFVSVLFPYEWLSVRLKILQAFSRADVSRVAIFQSFASRLQRVASIPADSSL